MDAQRMMVHCETMLNRRRQLVDRLETCPEVMRPMLEGALAMVDVTLNALLALLQPGSGPVQ